MTLSDFKAASQGNERLAWARWLCYICGHVSDSFALTLKPQELTGSGVDSDYHEPDWFEVADAVLAELARQRTDAWHKGHAEGVKSMTTI